MNKIIKIVSVVILIGGLGFAGYKLFFQEGNTEEAEIIQAEKDKETQKEEKKESALPVKVMVVKRGELPLRLKITATAHVWEQANIKSELNEKIEGIHCSVGNSVKKGQMLVKLDEKEIQLEVERAKSIRLKNLSNFLVKESTIAYSNPELTEAQKREFEKIKAKYKNALDDFEKGKISESRFEKINDEYERALVFSGALREEVLKATENLTEAIINLKKAMLDLNRTSIRAPFKGIIADLKASTGERINVGQEVLKIVNLDSLYFRGFALESEIGKLTKSTRVRIKLDSFPDRHFFGEIQAISPEVNQETKTITIFIKVDNSENLILPGMNAEIGIEYKVFKDVIKVPLKAKQVRGDRPVVFVIKDNIADWRYVEEGAKNDEELIIKSGLEEGELVVIEGHMTLAHQSRVKIIETIQ